VSGAKNAGRISVRTRKPPIQHRVLGYVSDRSVGIEDEPAVVWIDGDGGWWSGLPGHYLDLRLLKWRVTHWKPIDDAPRATLAKEGKKP
jgi:hypothetical protein